MRNLLLALSLAVPTLASGQAPGAERRTPRPAVIVLAFDGFARRYLDEDSAPTFHAVAREGVTGALIPSFPTVTFPNFYTLATGLTPDHSGMVNNSFYDPAFDTTFVYTQPIARQGRWWSGEPIWNTAGRQGLRSATMFWVGSDAPIGGRHPTYWSSFDVRVRFEARMLTVLGWLALPDSLRPALMMAYLEEPDHTGHGNGPDAPQTKAMVLRVDSMLAIVVNGLKARGMWDSVNLVIVADHGMTATTADRVVYLDDAGIDSARVRVVNTGPFLMIESRDGQDAALLAKLRTLPHLTAWAKDSVPARLAYGHNARVTRIVGVMDDGWVIAWKHGRPLRLGGNHGYDNADPMMRAVFVAHGPAFKAGSTLGDIPNVDVYPLLARLLGVLPAPNDGSVGPFEPVLR